MEKSGHNKVSKLTVFITCQILMWCKLLGNFYMNLHKNDKNFEHNILEASVA